MVLTWMAVSILCIVAKSNEHFNSPGYVDSDYAIATSMCKVTKKIAIVATCACIALHFIKTFVPTTKEYAAMYVVPKIVNNEDTKEICNSVVDIAKDWLVEIKKSGVKK